MVSLKGGMKPGTSSAGLGSSLGLGSPAGRWRGLALWWRARMLASALWRRLGWALPATVLAACLCVLALLMNRDAHLQLDAGRRAAAAMPLTPVQGQVLSQIRGQLQGQGQLAGQSPGQPPGQADDDRSRLQAFLKGLPDHQDIPAVLQDLITLAQTEGVVLAKGEYQVQLDPAGGFARYRMTMPVRGKGAVVRRFVGEALRTHPYLALDSVQLRRERADAAEVEAKVQWVLLTRLPEGRP
jgi:hypothetical protein